MGHSAKEIVARYDRLVSKRRLYEPDWQEIGDFIIPTKSNIDGSKPPGTNRSTKQFDSTAPHALGLLVSTMHGALVNQAIKWFSLRMRMVELMQKGRVRAWLEECRDIMLDVYKDSNFDSEVDEFFTDLAGYGTGNLLAEEEEPASPMFRGLLFRSIPVGEYVIAENAKGRVNTVMRKFKLSGAQAEEEFGLENLSDPIQKAIKRDADEEHEFIHAVYPAGKNPPRKSKNFEFVSLHIDVAGKIICKAGGYHKQPYLVTRWKKCSGEVWGYCQSHIALPDVKTLNKAKELGLRAWAKGIDPPIQMLDDGMVGAPRMTPSAINIVRAMDNIKAIEQKSNVQLDSIKTQELVASIRFMYFYDQLQPLPQNDRMTATEVEMRAEIMNRILGPTMGRLNVEQLNPNIERTFDILLRRKVLPPPPPEVIEASRQGGGNIDVEYEGPLARAQRNTEATATERALSSVAQLVTIDQSVKDNVNLDEATKIIVRSSGAPERILYSEEDVQVRRKERNDQAMQMAQMQQAATVAQAAGQAAPMVKAVNDMQQGSGQPPQGQPQQ